MLRIARALDAMRLQASEAAAVADEVGLRQSLPAHNQYVPVQPRLVEPFPVTLCERPHVGAGDDGADARRCVFNQHATASDPDFQAADLNPCRLVGRGLTSQLPALLHQAVRILNSYPVTVVTQTRPCRPAITSQHATASDPRLSLQRVGGGMTGSGLFRAARLSARDTTPPRRQSAQRILHRRRDRGPPGPCCR